jgi:hypothetical protein
MDQAKIDIVKNAIKTIGENMPFLITLTDEEKASLPKFGDKSLGFVKKTLELAKKNPDFLPRNFDEAEFEKDVILYEQLYSIIQPMTMLMGKMSDTFREVGAESYIGGLVVYNSAKQADKDTGGLESVMDEIGKRFSRKLSSKKEGT